MIRSSVINAPINILPALPLDSCLIRLKHREIMTTVPPHLARQAANIESVKRNSRNQELYNPCLKEHHLSSKCLENNNYAHEKCAVFFDNYKTCKNFWSEVMKDRKSRGISPILPLPEERNVIKEEYFNSRKL